MKLQHIFWNLVHLAGTLAMLTAGLTAAYFITGAIFARLPWHPHPLVLLVINTVLGMCLVVFGVLAIRLPFRRSRAAPFANIIGALERIAKGDFSTRLDVRARTNGVVADLVNSVNNMAVRLDEMEKMRREFVSDVSHEIQSPLTSIRGFACALRQEQLTATDRLHYLDIIESESMRLSNLSTNLLKLASLETPQAKGDPREYRLDSQIRGLILACEPQWSAKGINLEAVLDEATIRADEELLSQVWINLIHNAVKFTPKGGTIRVGLTCVGGRVKVTVADTGVGIAPEDQPRVFERFFKADASRRRTEGGSGLGLAIAKKVVEMHRGTIVVESALGSGTVFTVELPLQ